MGLSVAVSHLFGDIPSPYLIGLLKNFNWGDQANPKSTRNFYTLELCNAALLLCTAIWFLGAFVAKRPAVLDATLDTTHKTNATCRDTATINESNKTTSPVDVSPNNTL
jgi:hypothetical protein